MSDNKIKVGFVGLSATDGWAATALAPALLHPSLRDAYDLVAVSTTSEASAQASANKYSKDLDHPIKAYFGDASKIASDPNVDMVAVAVKAPYHKNAVLSVIEAKKDFFVEWPARSNTKETEEIAAAARKQGVRSLVGLQGRHSTVTLKVKELLASGIIGTVRSTNVFAHVPRETGSWTPYLMEKNAYTIEKKTGVNLLSIAVGHQLDILTHVLGKFVNVTATDATVYPILSIIDKEGKPTGKTYEAQQPDHFVITGFLKDGILANIFWRAGYNSTGRREFIWEIEGEEGTIRVESNELMGALTSMFEPDLYLNGNKVYFENPGNVVTSTTVAWKEFADRTLGNYATIEEAVKHHRLIDAIEESAKEGKRITL